MTTRVTEGSRRERQTGRERLETGETFLASRGFAAQRSRVRSLPVLNLKKKRDCSQSRLHKFFRAFFKFCLISWNVRVYFDWPG